MHTNGHVPSEPVTTSPFSPQLWASTQHITGSPLTNVSRSPVTQTNGSLGQRLPPPPSLFRPPEYHSHEPSLAASSSSRSKPPASPSLVGDEAKSELLELLQKALRDLCRQLHSVNRVNHYLEQKRHDLERQVREMESRACSSSNRHFHTSSKPLSPAAQTKQPSIHNEIRSPSIPASTNPQAPGTTPSNIKLQSISMQHNDRNEARASISSNCDGCNLPACKPISLKLPRELIKSLGVRRSSLKSLCSAARGAESDESDASDAGSEVFEANSPEQVRQMQELLRQLSRRISVLAEKKDKDDLPDPSGESADDQNAAVRSTFKESMGSAWNRSGRARLAPGLASDTPGSFVPPRRLTIYKDLQRRNS